MVFFCVGYVLNHTHKKEETKQTTNKQQQQIGNRDACLAEWFSSLLAQKTQKG